MQLIFKALLALHIAAGFASLIIFWIPVFTRKGGINHVKLGKAYVWLMWVVVGTAAILSIKNLATGRTIMGAFLGFIALITANPLWYGIGILRNKQNPSKRFRAGHLAFRLTIVLAALALIGYGIALGGEGAAVLMFLFGALGLTDVPGVVKALRGTATHPQWFKEHIVAMCTSGIAAYTAFEALFNE